MEAIKLETHTAVIDEDECVECGVCYRSKACPVDAFVFDPVPWPRSVRNAFSDPLKEHRETGMAGRGTEEMKTNDVTGRYKRGWVGMGCEFGRPGVGARLSDLNKVARALAKYGVEFEPKNPVTALMVDRKTGEIRADVLNEKVLSATLECVFPMHKLEEVLGTLRQVSLEVNSVFSCEVINRADPDGSFPVRKKLDDMGMPYNLNGKQNAGLGRPRADS
jgi:hypothetical protein